MLANDNIKKVIDFELAKIHDVQRKSLIKASDLAIKALIDVVEHGSGSAKVSAANSILDRSGHRVSEKLDDELSQNLKLEEESVSHEERVDNFIRHLVEKFPDSVLGKSYADSKKPQ